MVVALPAIVLLLQVAFGSLPQQEPGQTTATVEGVVVRAGSGQPLSRALVTLVRTAAEAAASDDRAVTSPAALPTITTGDDGRFVLRNVEPGSYRIAVARNGYARQEYGQRVFGGQGRTVTLVAGQTVAGIVFRLIPAGTVSGIVRDSSGEPIVGAQVQLLRSTYNAYGQRTLQTVAGDRTDDRGEYRVYWVTPGRYYVAVLGAVPGRAVALLTGAGSPNQIVDGAYPTSYHPGTVDFSQASAVDVQPGGELPAVDVVVPTQDVVRIRGRILDPLSGQQPLAASVSIVQRGLAAATGAFTGSTPTYNVADGTFEFREVAPGPYWIRATASGGSGDAILPASAAGRTLADVFVDSLFADRRAAQVAIDVFGDVDGLVLTLGAGVSIPGRLTVEGQPLSAAVDLERVEVTLRPATAGMMMNPSRHQPGGSEGAFTLENVLPGEYRVSVQSLPPDYYVKEARLDQTDARERLVVSGPARGVLSVVLGSSGGRIDGVVLDERRRPVPGIQAVLVPARRPAPLDLYKTAATDQAGQFVIRGIAPGDYTVLAWEAIEAFGYFDEDVLRQSEQGGTPIRVSDSSTQRVEVKVVPASLP